MMANNNTKIIISYDYELSWGPWDKVPIQYIETNVKLANKAALMIIDAHKKHRIPCTWAIVGALLDVNNCPVSIMNASKRNDDVKQRFEEFCKLVGDSEALFKADVRVVEQLVHDDLFEVGSHTHTHLYSLESSFEELMDDFKRFKDIYSERIGGLPVSLVMPKNQISQDSIRVASDNRFSVVRTNPHNWLYVQKERTKLMAFVIRILRILDSFLPIVEFLNSGTEYNSENCDYIVGQYFIRPALKNRFLKKAHLLRLRFGLKYCVFIGRDCHLWSHPHNFGSCPESAINFLETLMSDICKLRKEQKVTTCTMQNSLRDSTAL